MASSKRSNQQENSSGGTARKPKKRHTVRWIVIIVLIIVAVMAVMALRRSAARKTSAVSQYTYSAAERRDITDTLTGSGTLEPADSYTVTTLISGEILAADFEEGSVVSKGDILYEIDSSDTTASIEQAEISLAQSRRSYEKKLKSVSDLTINAPISGSISGITVKTGDKVSSQKIAEISDTSSLTLTEYYSDEYSSRIYKGMSASLSVADKMLNLTGEVSKISQQKRISDTGVSCFAVTVRINNPGSLSKGTKAVCKLTDGDETIYPTITDSDGLDAIAVTTVYAEVSGTVANVCVGDGENVTAGQEIVLLTSDTLNDDILNAADSVRNAELSLQKQKDALNDYTIKAPIDGTIVDKNYKKGETSEKAQPLCIIYDLSYLTLTLNVDELDINQVSVGQNAAITADAMPGQTYKGVITKVGINGTTTGGVTSYPVTIRIDEPGKLLPSMNVDVSIITKESKNTLAVPAEAVEHGGRVLVKNSDGSTGEGAPAGLRYAQVETGASDGDYIEILSGLTDGDTVAYIAETAAGSNLMGPFRAARTVRQGASDPDSVQGAGGNAP